MQRARRTIFFAVLLSAANLAVAQQPAPQADPGDFGLLLPKSAAIRPGEGRRVTVKNAAGKEVVANIHADVGDRRLLVMPGGRLASFDAADTKPTSQPFVPASKEELAAEFTSKTFKGFKTRKTARYLYVYNSSEEFFTGTSRILETMYPPILAYYKRLKFDVHDPATPLVAIMFRTEEEFQKYHEMPSGVVAYYTGVSNYIVMYEQSKLVDLAPDLAVRQSIGTIAHEGIHQILHNIGVQERLAPWPLWLGEGLAEYFAPTSVDKRLRWKGVNQVNDMRMYELEQFLKSGSAVPGEMVEATVKAQRLTSTGYASAWALTHYLANRQRDKFNAYCLEVAKARPLDDMNESVGGGRVDQVAVFNKYFGADYPKIEADLIKYLKQLPYTNPIENQTYFLVMYQMAKAGAIQRGTGITSSPAAVRQFQEEISSSVPEGQRQGILFEVRPFPNKEAAKAFADLWRRGG